MKKEGIYVNEISVGMLFEYKGLSLLVTSVTKGPTETRFEATDSDWLSWLYKFIYPNDCQILVVRPASLDEMLNDLQRIEADLS